MEACHSYAVRLLELYREEFDSCLMYATRAPERAIITHLAFARYLNQLGYSQAIKYLSSSEQMVNSFNEVFRPPDYKGDTI